MALQLDPNKSADKLRLNLQKVGIVTPPVVELAFNLDVSGSFEDEHRDGVTNDLMARLVPWGLTFDPDRKLDVFTFSDGPRHVHYVGDVNPMNYENFVRKQIIRYVPGWNGGTDYSYVLERNLQHFGWASQAGAPEKPKSMFGRFFGGGKSSAPLAPVEKKRSLVIHVTDGDNSDKSRTEQVLATSVKRGDEVYFLFIGVSNQGGNFSFLQEIGDQFGNTGLVVIRDIRRFVERSDDELNEQLLGEELIDWLKK